MKNCFECNQECCNDVIVEIDQPVTVEDWEEIKWKVSHENVRVILDNDDDWCVEFLTKCKYLGNDGKCTIYGKRPAVCKNHDPETCVVNGGGSYYKVILENIGDVEDYLKKHLESLEEEREVEVNVCPECGCEFVDEDED